MKTLIEPPVLAFAPGCGETKVDVSRLLSGRLLIQGTSGAGKSWLIRYLCESLAKVIPQIIIDWEGDFTTLREVHPYIVVGLGDDADIVLNVDSIRRVCRSLASAGASIVVDLSDLVVDDRREVVSRFFDELIYRLPKADRRRYMVVVDEAHELCPQVGDVASSGALKSLVAIGRKRGLHAVLATQRLAKLHKDAAEVQSRLYGWTVLDVDVRRAADDLGLDIRGRAELKSLTPGTWFALGPAIGDGSVQLVRSGCVVTRHPSEGEIAPPPLPSEVAVALQGLSDVERAIDDAGRQELLDLVESLEAKLKEARDGNTSDPADIRRAVDQATAPLREEVQAMRSQVEYAKAHARLILLGAGEIPVEQPIAVPPELPAPTVVPEPPAPESADIGALHPKEKDILRVVHRSRAKAINKASIADKTGQSPDSSTYRAHLKRLKDLGYIVYLGRTGNVQITPQGEAWEDK